MLLCSYPQVPVVLMRCSSLASFIIKLRRNAFSKPLTASEFIMQTPRNVLVCATPSRYPLGTGFVSLSYLKEETFPSERHCMTYCSSESGLSSHRCRIYKPHSRKEIRNGSSWCLWDSWTKPDRTVHSSSCNFEPHWEREGSLGS